MKMKAGVLTVCGAPRPFAKSKPIHVVDVDLDPPGEGEVLLCCAVPAADGGGAVHEAVAVLLCFTGPLAAGADAAAACAAALAADLLRNGELGSQSLFFWASAASWSTPRALPLFKNGTGTLVTYTATTKAINKPTTKPRIKPTKVLPRCAELVAIHCPCYMTSGALTPNRFKPFFKTCAVA